MADACMPEKFYELARPMLPAEKEIGPQGGRRPTAHRTVLRVIWFVLVTSCRWKDVPQDARGLVEWKQRMDEVYPREHTHHLHDLAAFTDAELLGLARKYGAQFVVIDRTRARRPIGLPRIYPLLREDNDSFDVYRVPPQANP